MSGSIYQVGVHLTAKDGVSGVLANISKSLFGLHGGVEHLQKGFNSLQLGVLGAASVAAGMKIGHVVENLVEHGMELRHWQVQLQAAGFTAQQVAAATSKAWEVAGTNMNTTATENLKNIIELNKATGDLKESMKLLPTFALAQNVLASVKSNDIKDKFSHNSTQTLNFARGLEELGVTQMGKTPEEREANVKRYAQAYMKTMIASRGLFDGNALFAMTNNSGGAAQNWDFNMATQVAPILGEVMKASKLGNADYMAIRSYQGGHITSDAAQALVKNHLAKFGDEDDASADVYKDKRGFHLKANSHFAEGMEKNIWTWSTRILEQMKANGVDISNQHAVNAIINSIGSNKSTSMLMRAVLEPLTRLQMEKEFKMQSQVPNDAAGIINENDPWKKLEALKLKWNDFLTALGGPLVDPAIKALDMMTKTLNTMSQYLVAHPETAELIGKSLAALSGGLIVLGGVLIGTAIVAALGPTGWLIAGLGLLASTITAIDPKFWGKFIDGWKTIWDGIKNFDASTVGAGLLKVLSAELNLLPSHLQSTILSMVANIKDNFATAITNIPNELATAFTTLTTSIANGIKNAFKAIFGSGNASTAGKTGDASESLPGIQQESYDGAGFGNLLKMASYTNDNGGGAKALIAGGVTGGLTNCNVVILGGAGGAMGAGGSGGIGSYFGGGGRGGGGRGGSGSGVNSHFYSGGGSGSNQVFSNKGIESVRQYIRTKAASLGIDPNIAERVARSEGLNSTLGAGGDHGLSDGPFQLYTGGGLGNIYQKLYGRSVHDKSPQALKDQIDFALGHAAKNGWGSWYGARNSHIGNFQGIGRPMRNAQPPTASQKTEHIIHTNLHVDGKVMARNVTKHQTDTGRFPTSVGAPDSYGSFASPGTPFTDAA